MKDPRFGVDDRGCCASMEVVVVVLLSMQGFWVKALILVSPLDVVFMHAYIMFR